MRRRKNSSNLKRKLQKHVDLDFNQCRQLAEEARYGGNPEHKRNPGDFALNPPCGAGSRPNKSFCDDAGIVSRRDALKHLRSGLANGMISDRFVGKWPKNVYAVTDDGIPLEAQLEQRETGTYHGYRMSNDPLSEEVLNEWAKRQQLRREWEKEQENQNNV